MKKVLSVLMLAVACLFMQSCEKLEEIFSFGNSVTVTVNIDANALQVDNVKVQTLVESVDCGLDSAHCTVQVFSNGKPQIIAVTDANNKLLMMFRGPVSNGAVININAHTTANALVTFNPLYGPIPAADFTALTSIIEGAEAYQDYSNAVATAISLGRDLTDTNNAQVLGMLHNLLRELSEQAFAGQDNLDAAAINASSFINCYPLIAYSDGSSLTLRTSGNCPSYYGELLDGDGNKVQDVAVTAASRYAFMDNLGGTVGNNSYGTPTTIPFVEGGGYTLLLSCTAESAILDFYIRMVNNILGTLGADIDPVMVSAITPILKRNVAEMGIDITDIKTDDVMRLVCRGYDVVLEYLRGEGQILSGDANWDLGSVLLSRLNDVYTVLRSTTDALLRTTYNFVGSNAGEEIPGRSEPGVEVSDGATTVILRVIFIPATDELPAALIPQEGIDIAIVSGNNQSAQAFHTLANPLQVRVRTFDGNGNTSLADGYNVRFVVANGGGQMQNDVVTTDANGIASNNWTLGGGTSGLTQSAYAVVVNANGDEISSRAYFTALISNDRYRISLCCDWADHTNYLSQFDVDFSAVSNESGVVSLIPAAGPQWDYGGLNERFEMTGTINNNTKAVDMEVAMYVTDRDYVTSDVHYRTDLYSFTLQGSDFSAAGTLIWDGMEHGQEWGAGCGQYIWIHKLGETEAPISKSAPTAIPAGKVGSIARARK